MVCHGRSHADLKFHDLSRSYSKLYCDSCRIAAANLQKMRADALANPEDPQHGHQHVHNLALHLQKRFMQTCNVTHFEGTEAATEHGAARMHVMCKHVLDWWDWAGEEAEHENQRPWFLADKLLPQVIAGGMNKRLLLAEIAALCEVGKSDPPCPKLKEEL